MGVVAIHLHLGEHGKTDAVILFAEGADLWFAAGLLRSELVQGSPAPSGRGDGDFRKAIPARHIAG